MPIAHAVSVYATVKTHQVEQVGEVYFKPIGTMQGYYMILNPVAYKVEDIPDGHHYTHYIIEGNLYVSHTSNEKPRIENQKMKQLSLFD